MEKDSEDSRVYPSLDGFDGQVSEGGYQLATLMPIVKVAVMLVQVDDKRQIWGLCGFDAWMSRLGGIDEGGEGPVGVDWRPWIGGSGLDGNNGMDWRERWAARGQKRQRRCSDRVVLMRYEENTVAEGGEGERKRQSEEES